MDKILHRINSIENHPIAALNEKFRIKYIKGLGACLFVLSNNSPITHLLFIPWAKSIIGKEIDANEYWHDDLGAAQEAISLQHKGWRLFYMKDSFFFDVFYLLSHSFLPQYDETATCQYLKEKVCGFWSKGSLEVVYDYWCHKRDKPDQIDMALVEHRQQNERVFQKQEKRILVVANVSAGKSTLINAMIGWHINPTRNTACTNQLVALHNKCFTDGFTSKLNDGSYCYDDSLNGIQKRQHLAEVAFPFHSSLAKEAICLVDTPGMNNASDSSHRAITEDAIVAGEYDGVLYVSNSLYFGTNDEHDLLQFLKAKVKKPIIFVLNQLDNFNPEEDSIAKMINDFQSDLKLLGFKHPTVVPISGYAAYLLRLPPTLRNKIEKRKVEMLEELFNEDYYDLPTYIGEKKSSDILSKTGILNLENKILNL